MKAGELIEKVSRVSPDTEIIGRTWNGRVDTYTVLDECHVFPFESVSADFHDRPGAFDEEFLKIRKAAMTRPSVAFLLKIVAKFAIFLYNR